jgi:hypothetical protein
LKANEFSVSAFSVVLVLYTTFRLAPIQVLLVIQNFKTVVLAKCKFIGFKRFLKTKNFESNQFLDVIIILISQPTVAQVLTLKNSVFCNAPVRVGFII